MESTSGAKVSWRIPAIDGVRALAMLMVYTFHVWQFSFHHGDQSHVVSLLGLDFDLQGVFRRFALGVDLFMVLSGFCLFLPLCKTPRALYDWDWRSYARRRIRRIVPPYYAAIVYTIALPVVLVALFRVLHLTANWQPFPSAWQVITHLLFIHTLFYATWDGINGSFWSLGLEAQFYLVFPLIVYGFRRWNTRVLVLIVAISVLYRLIISMYTDDFVSQIFFLGRWMEFAFGMGAAWIVARYWREGKTLDGTLGTVVLALSVLTYSLAACIDAPVWMLTFRDLLLSAAFSAAITALCITRTPVRALFANKVSAGLGFMSYSIFLIHQPTAWYLSGLFEKKLHVSGAKEFVLFLTVGFLIVLGISYVFFLVFEKPFLTAASKVKKAPNREILPPGTVQEQAAP